MVVRWPFVSAAHRCDLSSSLLQPLASALAQILHLSVDEQEDDDSAQNERPIGNWNARYRCFLAEPFHDFPPVLRSLVQLIQSLEIVEWLTL